MRYVATGIFVLALAACGSGHRVVATNGTVETVESAPADWRPVPMANLAFESKVTETFRPDGDVLRLVCRVGATVVNRGSGSGSAAVRLGVGLADGTKLTETIILDLGSGGEEYVEATFDLTDREDEITGPLKYIHQFLDKP